MSKQVKDQVSTSEIAVLRSLRQRLSRTAETAATEIGEIATETGIRDSDEILRALYTLEGKSLVQPEPAGDLTSHHWKITDVGVKALTVLSA